MATSKAFKRLPTPTWPPMNASYIYIELAAGQQRRI
jgi:hypothetical protein